MNTANNKYVLEFGFDSGYTKRIYIAFYINEQGVKELINIKYANPDDLNDRNEAVQWFKTILTNHNATFTDKNNKEVIAEFNATDFNAIDDEINIVATNNNENIETINYDELYTYIDKAICSYLSDINDYIYIEVDERKFCRDVINDIKSKFHEK
jgi:hypothetical protein